MSWLVYFLESQKPYIENSMHFFGISSSLLFKRILKHFHQFTVVKDNEVIVVIIYIISAFINKFLLVFLSATTIHMLYEEINLYKVLIEQ